MGSQEDEEEEYCWIWRAKLTILVALRSMFLLADLLILCYSSGRLLIDYCDRLLEVYSRDRS